MPDLTGSVIADGSVDVAENPYSFKGRVLLVSPDMADHLALQRIVGQPEWALLRADNALEARQVLSDAPVAAILADSRCWKTLQVWAMEFPLIVFDRLADDRLWVEVLRGGGYDVVSKPFQAKEILRVLRMACRRGRSVQSQSLKANGCAEGQAVANPELESAGLVHP